MSSGNRNKLLLLVVIVALVALAARLPYALSAEDYAPNELSDSARYRQWADNVLEEKETFPGAFHLGPLYAYFLAGVFFVFGKSASAALALQAVLGALACVFIFLAGRAALGVWPGFMAGLALALYRPAVFYDGTVLAASISVFLLSLLLLLLARGIEKPTKLKWALVGAVTGLLVLAKGSFLVLVPAVPLAMLVAGEGNFRKRLRERLPALAAFLVAAVVIVGPVVIRNSVRGGGLLLTGANAGINLFIGNNPHADGTYARPPGLDASTDFIGKKTAETISGENLTDARASSFWTKKAASYALENPGRTAALAGKKLAYMLGGYEVPQVENMYHAEKEIPFLGWIPLTFVILGTLGIAGLVLGWKRNELRPYSVVALSLILVYMPFFVLARFRLATVPVFALGVGWLIYEVFRAIKEKRYKSVVLYAAALTIPGIIVVFPRPWVDAEADLARASCQEGFIAFGNGDNEKAKRIFENALKEKPLPEIYSNYGVVLYCSGELAKARAVYEKVMELDPEDGDTMRRLAELHAVEGRFDEAANLAEKAVKYLPYSYDIKEMARAFDEMRSGDDLQPRVALKRAQFLASKNRNDLAEKYFEFYVRTGPPDLWAFNKLGLILLEKKENRDAEIIFKNGVKHFPRNVALWNNLAVALEKQGKAREAQIARSAVEKLKAGQ